MTANEEQYWAALAEEEALMSEEENAIERMASKMWDETCVTQELDEVRDNLFRTQFADSFAWTGGPPAYWVELEKEWRKVSGGKPIPTKYRTNKSVILKAWRIDAEARSWMEHEKAVIMGKTAVQKKCMTELKVVKSAEGMARELIAVIDQYRKDAGDSEWESVIGLVWQYCEDHRS